MTINPTDRRVIDSIANRYSPYRFDDRSVEDEKIIRCLEAARWSASSFNDQPWSWILAKRGDADQFATAVDCLVEANRGWASKAGVLLFSVCRRKFRHNSSPNRVALHDVGQAAAMLSLQATDLGLQVHQMAGINVAKIRSVYGIPDGHDPETAIAIGYAKQTPPEGETESNWADREASARKRLPLAEQVFCGAWGKTASMLS